MTSNKISDSHPVGLSTSRIEAFSDGVFAIVITLLVIDLKVPQIAGDISVELGSRLFDLWPKLLSYLLSFVIVGVYWVAHHHVFHYICRVDRIALWLNLFFLMSVAFVPFPTALLGEYGSYRPGGNRLWDQCHGHAAIVGGSLVIRRFSLLAHQPGHGPIGCKTRYLADSGAGRHLYVRYRLIFP